MCRRLRAAAVPLASALAISAGAVFAKTSSDTSAWTGRWTGVAVTRDQAYHAEQLFDFDIEATDKALTIRDRDRLRGGATVPLTVNGLEGYATYKGLLQQPINLVARLTPGSHTLTVSIKGDGMTGIEDYRAILRHDDIAARRFLVPRLDNEGRRLLSYAYRAPTAAADGIPVSTVAAEGIDKAPVEAMIRDILAEGDPRDVRRTESVLVLRHGKLVLEEYFWGQTAENPHTVASVTKSVMSMLAGAVYDEGKLDLDRAVVDYFSKRQDLGWRRVTSPISVRNVLAMSSGTQFESVSTGAGSIGLLNTDDVVKYATSAMPTNPPGAIFNYDNSLPSLVGPLITSVTGKKVPPFAEEKLFGPLGIRNYRWTMLPEGIPLTAGGLMLRSRDMAKLGLTMLGNGTWRSKRILSPTWVRGSTRQQSAPGQYPYGFYWHLNTAERRHVPEWDGYMALGQGGQVIAVYPKQDLVIVLTSSNWLTGEEGTSCPTAIIGKYLVGAVH